MVKDYYSILGVQRTTSHDDIKRAYRRLAIKYHPDKNHAPEAEQLFKEINEAYDTIGDPIKRNVYDLRLENPFAEILKDPPAPRHRDPAYRRTKPSTPRPKSDRQRMLEFMAGYLPLANKVILGAFAISIFLLLDFLLPKRSTLEKIIAAENTRTSAGRTATAWWTITTDKGKVLDLPFSYTDYFLSGTIVKVRSSLFLNIPISVESELQWARIHKSIYSNFIFAPIILLICTSLGMRLRKDIENGFNYAIISLIAFLFTLTLYIIFHLL